MKRIAILLAAVMLCSCAASDKPRLTRNSPMPAEAYKPVVQSEISDENIKSTINYPVQKAVWISYIDLANPYSDDEETFRANMDKAFSNVNSIGCNTVYVHVRAFGDAYYDSKLFAKAKICQNASFDPLEIMLETAHKYKLSFHAWVNPFRLDTSENMDRMYEPIKSWYLGKKKFPEYAVRPEGENFYWLNPAKPEVRELIADGAKELAENYDIDGLHIDDYFYPTTDESFDEKTYKQSGTELSLSDWRKENCSQTVAAMYSAVKRVNKDILFGVSPQGNISNNDALSADVKRWCKEYGYLDYIVPQIYFGYENEICPFTQTLNDWEDLIENPDIDLVVGVGFYKISQEREYKLNKGLIADQISDVLSDKACSGFALYSYDGLFTQDTARFNEEREAAAAVILNSK